MGQQLILKIDQNQPSGNIFLLTVSHVIFDIINKGVALGTPD
jgi:hypothetical protein